MDRNRTGLTKTELLWRLWARSCPSIAPAITQAWLDDLLKDGLVPRAERIGNEGRSPIYRYDFRAYRRARQIIRFRQFGVRDRDSLTVLLFINGYSVIPSLVREALGREWTRWAANILGQVRSGYMGNWREIPPKHKAALVRDLGPLDPYLEAIGAPFSADFAIEVFRSASQSALANDPLPRSASGVRRFLKSLSVRGRVADLAISLVAGMLLLDPKANGVAASGIQRVVISASNADLDFARVISMDLTLALASRSARLFSGRNPTDETYRADRVIQRTIRHQPAFAALLLVIGLRLAPFCRDVPEADKRSALRWMKTPLFFRVASRFVLPLFGEITTKP